MKTPSCIPILLSCFITFTACQVNTQKYQIQTTTTNLYELFQPPTEKADLATTYIWYKNEGRTDTVTIKGADVDLGKSRLRLSLVKSGTGSDKILLSQYGQDTVFIDPTYSALVDYVPKLDFIIDGVPHSLNIRKTRKITVKSNSKEVRKDAIRYFSLVPDLSMKTLDSTVISLSSHFQKGAPLYVDLWHKRCKPCLEALPKIDSLAKAFEGRVQFAAVNTADGLYDMTAIKQRLGLELPMFSIKNSDVFYFDFTQIYPMGIVYDADGKMVDKIFYMEPSLLAAKFSALIGGKSLK